jgi:hemoglobin
MSLPATRPHPPFGQPLERPGVDRAFIGRFVRAFYRRVRADDRLGPIFDGVIGADWEPHLDTMTNFWCSVILKSGDYKGRPVPAHLKLTQVVEADFDIWLGLFRRTAGELDDPDVAAVFVERAERIAQSLKLAMFARLPAVRPMQEQ